MFARMWWKEARQTWPVWGFLALMGMLVQSSLFSYWGAEVPAAGYAIVALVVTMTYLFLVAAAVFAGEREGGTLWILDAMPAERLRVWSAKASFALVTTLALGLLLWLSALAFGRYSPEWQRAGVVALVWGLMALGWGLFWSAALSNALHAAVLAMISLCLTLLPLVDLQHGPAVEQTPILLAVAILTTGASAWLFHVTGPPRWQRRRARLTPATTVVAVPTSNPDSTIRRRRRIWSAAVPRLFWETSRQVRAELWILMTLAVTSAVIPRLITWPSNRFPSDAAMFMGIGAFILALMNGVLVFNVENRGQTHRFLLHHGARPGVVWAVKVVTWWVVSLGLWSIAFAFLWPWLPPFPLRGFASGSLFSWAAWGLTIPFAIAVICGMAFRRGILAAMIALVAILVVVVPLFELHSARVMFPWHWPYIAIGLLGISWAWSGDWLHDRPGWKRWARLAIYTAAAPAILAPLYIAERSWSVPTLPPKQANTFFDRARIVSSIPEVDNAAPLYFEAARIMSRNAYPTPESRQGTEDSNGGMAASINDPTGNLKISQTPGWASDVRLLDQQSFDPPPPWIAEWLVQVEPALVKLREGGQKRACRYFDLRTATEFDRTDGPPIQSLVLPLAISARVRQARGDLDGAWVEVETLLRLARQYSYTSLWSSQLIEPVANATILRWAADPRQTVATLEKAARAWKAIPPGAAPVDRFQVDVAIFHNTLELPPEMLVEKLLYGQTNIKRKLSPTEKLHTDLQTTPWEIARTRKVFDLLAGAQIQRLDHVAYPFIPPHTPVEQQQWFHWMVDPKWGFLVLEDGGALALNPDELSGLASTTPLLDHAAIGRNLTQLAREQTFKNMIWLTLLLRLHQARHDGKLPQSLDEIVAASGADTTFAATEEDLKDPYSGAYFGYVASHKQLLLPIGTIEVQSSLYARSSDPLRKPAENCWLLYSVGPDGSDERGGQAVEPGLKGDIVFPLKNDIKPPGGKPR